MVAHAASARRWHLAVVAALWRREWWNVLMCMWRALRRRRWLCTARAVMHASPPLKRVTEVVLLREEDLDSDHGWTGNSRLFNCGWPDLDGIKRLDLQGTMYVEFHSMHGELQTDRSSGVWAERSKFNRSPSFQLAEIWFHHRSDFLRLIPQAAARSQRFAPEDSLSASPRVDRAARHSSGPFSFQLPGCCVFL
jgi:hypothetical protein